MRPAVDFTNPDSIESELAAVAVDTTATKAKKVKKEAKPRIIKVSFVATADVKAGETITFDYEVPRSTSSRGIVAGIALEDMSDDQLKIEYRNAGSVAYKTKKAGRDASKAEARLEACKAEMTKRNIQPTGRGSVAVNESDVVKLIKEGKLSVDQIQALLDGAEA